MSGLLIALLERNRTASERDCPECTLILLAQNRQDDRDRANIERDREVAARTQADTEFLARELAAVRLALADVVTTRDLEQSLSRLAKLTDGRPLRNAREFRATPDRPARVGGR